MRKCKKCDNTIPNRYYVNGLVKNTQNRKYCFECSPWNSGNTRDLTKEPSYINGKRITTNKTQEQKISLCQYIKNRRIEFRQNALKYKGSICVLCGYNKCNRAFDFHHVDPNTKKFNISSVAYTYTWEEVILELDKCILLCANCHREVEEGYTIIPQDIIDKNKEPNALLNGINLKMSNISLNNEIMLLSEEEFNTTSNLSISELARKYNVARKTIHKWILERKIENKPL